MGVRRVGLVLLWGSAVAVGQAPTLGAISPLNAVQSGLAIRQRVRPENPFTVAGPRGVLVGQQDGGFEAWLLPVKLLSHFRLRAQVKDYAVPIELNPMAAEIEVYPDRTVITYTHLALTVRQTMFAPEQAEAGTGAVVLFEVDSVRPVELTFSFRPEMRPMWPKPTQGSADAEWVATPGAYVLHTDFPNLAGAVTIPGAQPGVMAPYQEKPQTHPVELKLAFDPVRDKGKVYPLLMAMGQTPATATNAALMERLARLNRDLPELYRRHAATYADWQSRLTSIVTPDVKFNDAFAWGELAIEQLRAKLGDETGLVAGYFDSGDSARPGFGWFFGRDTLYTLYAVHGMGDFELSRDALAFLIKRQRDDGKMMHEYSQSAGDVDWKSLGYMYAAADATPLFLLAMRDYVQSSGDVAFLRANREAVKKAWEFERTHDSDGDGIYDNVQGTGWVESWPGGQPHQEIYLALLDQQASTAMGALNRMLGDKAGAQAAEARAGKLRQTIEAEYYDAATGRYAFSRNADGSVDKTRTVYPALAYWNSGSELAHPEASFAGWDSHDFSTDWGVRDVAESDPVYDSMSYHQGSVWPLFTGWAAMADYRTGRALSGYAHLMQNADQTTTQDPGSVTELLSGAFFQPFGRSTSHQLWSSAMVLIPALRGMFGLEVDALAGTIKVEPRLPAEWPGAELRNVHVGEAVCDVRFVRDGQVMRVTLTQRGGKAVRLVGADGRGDVLRVPLPAVEVGMPHGLPLPGARTMEMKVLAETREDRSVTLVVEGVGGTAGKIFVRENVAGLEVRGDGVELTAGSGGVMEGMVRFEGAGGYKRRTILLRW